MRSYTFNHEIPHPTDPDEGYIEVEITVSYSVMGADPSVGIMSASADDICVTETSTPLFPVEDAQEWLDKGYCRWHADGHYRPDDKGASYVLEAIHEQACQREYED